MRKTLLAGTAIAALGVFGMGQVAAQPVSDSAGGIWSSSGTNNDDGTLAEAEAGEDLNISGLGTFIVFTNDQTANDGGGFDNFSVGNITDSGGPNNGLTFSTSNASNLSVIINGTTDLTGALFINNSADDGDVAVQFGGNVQAGGFTINGSDVTTSDVVNVVMWSDASFASGGSTITAGDNAGGGATSQLTIGGDATFGGSVAINGGAGDATNNATLSLSGANNVFANGVTLNDDVGTAMLVIGTTGAAQVVDGTISGAAAGEGDIFVTNTGLGVTFNGAIVDVSGIDVDLDGNDQVVSFTNHVSVIKAIELGGIAGSDTITATFGGALANQMIAGDVTGGTADTANVNIIGGNTVTQTSGVWQGINILDISGNSTFDSQSDLTATAITIDAGSTLQKSGGTLTADFLNNGTVTVDNAGIITGGFAGSGTLDVNAGTVVTGNLSQGLVTIAPAIQLIASGTINTDVQLEGAGARFTTNGVSSTTFTGDITTTGGPGTGEVSVIDGTSIAVFNGNIGTASATLATLRISNDAATQSQIQTTGDLYVDAIILGENDALVFRGTGSQTVSGTIVGTTPTGAVSIGVGDGSSPAPTVTFNDTVGGNNNIDFMLISEGAHAIFNADATFNDTVNVAPNTAVTVNAGVDFTTKFVNDGGVITWNIGVTPTDVGQVAYTSDGVDLSNDSVNFLVDGSLVGVAVLDDVFTGNAAAIIAGATVTDDSFLYSFSLVEDGNNVDVNVIVEKSATDAVENPGFAAAGELLLTGALAGSTDPEIGLLQTAIISAPTKEETSKTIEAVTSPNMDGGAIVAGLAMGNQTANINSQRLTALRNGTETGVSAGNGTRGGRAWAQAFGTTGEQDDRGGVSGFDIDSHGLAFGADTERLLENAIVGLAVAYAGTEVESEGLARATTDIDSYQVVLYGDYDFNNRTYVSGQLSYIWSQNETTRNPGGVSSLTANGEYDSSQVGIRAEMGRTYETGNVALTPKLLANYVHYTADSYTETGAGGANLTVESDGLDLFELGIGMDATWDIANADGSRLQPALSVGIRHDVIGDEIQASNRFQAGGPAVSVTGVELDQTSLDVGASISYFRTDNWDLTVGYDYQVSSDYSSHGGLVKATYSF